MMSKEFQTKKGRVDAQHKGGEGGKDSEWGLGT